jgi:hypothetical protein
VGVPPRVLSEAFRDVDLFAVAGIAADPAWTDRGDSPHNSTLAQAELQ